MRKLIQLTRFSVSELWMLLQAIILLLLVCVTLRVFGFNICRRLLSRIIFLRSCLIEAGAPTDNRRNCIVKMTKIAARNFPIKVNCLPRSLVIWTLLQCYRFQAELRLGVQKKSEIFAAHAWVECSGIVINDSSDIVEEYKAFNNPFSFML